MIIKYKRKMVILEVNTNSFNSVLKEGTKIYLENRKQTANFAKNELINDCKNHPTTR